MGDGGEELRGFGEALAELIGVRGVDEQRHGLIAGDHFDFKSKTDGNLSPVNCVASTS